MMPCETCRKLGDDLIWLDFGIKIVDVPYAGLCAEELDLYQFFYESGLVWKVDHVDAEGHFWLCVQHDEHHYELLTPVIGSYRRVSCDTPYPVPRLEPPQSTTL